MKGKKSWADKMSSPKPHEVKPAPADFAGMKKGEIMLIPTARMIDDFIRTIPRGRGMDVTAMRQKLARQNKAEVSCPITTGILLRIVAEAAHEAHAAGADEVTPVWRVIDEKASVLKKLSFDAAFILDRRAREGI